MLKAFFSNFALAQFQADLTEPNPFLESVLKDKNAQTKAFINFLFKLSSHEAEAFNNVDQNKIDQLKKSLQNELNTNFLDSLVSVLGECKQSPCVQKKNGYQLLKLEKNNQICFPNTDCEFYRCMEEKYQCMKYGFEYFEKLAYPTCSNYLKRLNENKFSMKGIDWIYRVMVCLQKGLVEECDANGNCVIPQDQTQGENTCDYITDYTLKFHPGCYINSGVGICQLPIKDQLAIWKTVEPYLTKRERQEAYKVMWHCLSKGGKTN